MKPVIGITALVLAFANAFANPSQPASSGSYDAVIHASYGEKAEALAARKAAYRRAHPEITWLADYSRATFVVPIHYAAHPFAEGRYSWVTKTITVKPNASAETIRHELGHSLQPGVRSTAADVSYFEGHSRYAYLTDPEEFEVRLQALNRLATAIGIEITTPVDAAKVLLSMGVKPRWVYAALAKSGCDATPLTTTKINRRLRDEHRNAFDLVELLEITEWAPADVPKRESLVERIIIAAPGHL